MKIYTKQGDKGQTQLVGGTRTKKSNLMVESYGTVDELNSWVGYSRSLLPAGELNDELEELQQDLFDLGGVLSTPTDFKKQTHFNPERTAWLEERIDHYTEDIEPLKQFILPGGSQAASALHITRTISRRLERLMVDLTEELDLSTALPFVNRLSDYFFTIARWQNKQDDTPETAYRGR